MKWKIEEEANRIIKKTKIDKNLVKLVGIESLKMIFYYCYVIYCYYPDLISFSLPLGYVDKLKAKRGNKIKWVDYASEVAYWAEISFSIEITIWNKTRADHETYRISV